MSEAGDLPLPASSLPEALAAAAVARPATGLVFVDLHERERGWSWARLHRRAALVAAGLRAGGVGAGGAVAIVLPTGPDFVTALFGCLLAGALPAPLYPPVRLGRLREYGDGLARQLAAIEACLVISGGATSRLLARAVATARPPLGCRTVGALERTGRRTEASEAALRFPGAGSAPASPRRPPSATLDAPALIQFSSGTTAAPRPIVLTHRNLLWQCAALKRFLRPAVGPAPVGVSWLPLYHDMGLIGTLLSAVCWPGRLVLLHPEHFLARPALWLRAIARHRAAVSPSPGFALAHCVRRIVPDQLAGCDLSCWRALPCGAEPLSAAGLEAFAERFAPWGFDRGALLPAYGLAEATLAVTIAPPGRGPRVLAGAPRPLVSLGRPLPGLAVEIRDPAGRSLGEGRTGRIHVRGPSVGPDCLAAAEATRPRPRDGWLDTGDLGRLSDGELHVCGRAKDVIILRGANHEPDEFEEPARGVPGVRPGGVAALGYEPDDADGERLLLLVERERGRDRRRDAALAAAVRQAVREATAAEPHAVLVLDAGTLPRTSSGKLRRAEARRRHLAGELAPPRGAAAATAAEVVHAMAAAARRQRRRR